ncbi:MAG: ThuA domain-containing protein [Thermoguttaceae bacterium]|jgi:type 1 glutamine amidotransferase
MKCTGLICLGAALLAAAVTLACPATSRADVSADELKKIEAALPSKAPAKPSKPRKILVFDRTEGFHHDSIPVGDKAFELMGEKTGAYTVAVAHDMDVFTPENLAQYDAVLFENTTQLKFDDPKQRAALLDFVKGGKGFIGIHAATDNFPTWPEAVEMIGGQFNGHPWGAGGVWSMKVDDPKHVLNKSFGGKGFTLRDEIYQIKGPYSRDTHRVLLSLDMSKDRNKVSPNCGREDGDNPIAWIKRFGDGRVFYCSLGHNKEIYWNKAVLKHYLAGIQWALGDLKADETPSAKLATQPEPALAPK